MSVLLFLPPALHTPAWLALMLMAGLLGWALFSGAGRAVRHTRTALGPARRLLTLSAVSCRCGVAGLIGQVIDRINAGAIGAAASVCALLGLALAVANREMLRRQR